MKTLSELLDDLGSADRCKEMDRIREEIITRFSHKPYDCYWAQRALAAEKLLRELSDYANTIQLSGHSPEVTHQPQTNNWCAGLMVHVERAARYFSNMDRETGVPK